VTMAREFLTIYKSIEMQQLLHKAPMAFSNRQVSINQAIKILKRNGIQANEDQARSILNFLYLLARTYKHVQT
jgi:hypothetical protein